MLDRPFTFDVRRSPDSHVGYGGPGPHYCLGDPVRACLVRNDTGLQRLCARTQMASRLWPPLNSLRAFSAAARHLNFTRAAEELSMSQPAVSQQVRMLENHLGRTLFQRSGPTVRLTDDGHRLAAAVADSLTRIDDELNAFRTRSQDTCLEVRAISAFLMWWLLPRLPAFLDAHPEIELDLTASYWTESPRPGGAPIHIDLGPAPDGAELVVGPQTKVAVAHPEVAAGISQPSDLAGTTLLEVAGGDGWEHFLSGFDTEHQLQPHTHVSMTYLHTIEFARMRRGVALAHEMIVEDLLASGDLAIVAGMAQPSREHYYMVLPHPQLNSATTAFVDWLRTFRR